MTCKFLKKIKQNKVVAKSIISGRCTVDLILHEGYTAAEIVAVAGLAVAAAAVVAEAVVAAVRRH